MRRLAAILAADVVGYSRLMGEDEAGTLAALQAHRAEIFDPVIAERGGRLVKLMGDGALVEFPSVVEAVEAALAIQQQVAAGDGRIRLRIGINLGDIIIDGDDIYGDGVNVAARLEALAEPGGICISSIVHESIGNRVEAEFGDAGEHEVKGIARPIRVWQWPATGGAQAPLALPEKPSIAIMPFDNMSSDSEYEYFSDGITDDIATDLSKVSGLFVIARNATFAYKGGAADLKHVARELGVRYILEGSIRRADGKVRINARLVDANSGNHLWAERFDGDLKDIFALQDRITESIVAILAVTLTRAEQDRAMHKEVRNLQAYDYVLQGTAYHTRMTKGDNVKAMELFTRAIELDPDDAPAHASLAWALTHEANHEWTADPNASLKLALVHAKRAVLLDAGLAKAHMVLGDIYCWMKRHKQAVAEGRRAIALDPSYADGHMALAYFLITSGQAEEAIGEAQTALRFNPVYANGLYYEMLGKALYLTKQYEAAMAVLEQGVSRDPNVDGLHQWLAATYAQVGQMDDARTHAKEYLRLYPGVSLQHLAKILPYKSKLDLDHLLDGLRKAGLPE
ncbi:MAG: adenylate/guanylate cyclase domain-containing protein [Thermohalobaculum sp.]